MNPEYSLIFICWSSQVLCLCFALVSIPLWVWCWEALLTQGVQTFHFLRSGISHTLTGNQGAHLTWTVTLYSQDMNVSKARHLISWVKHSIGFVVCLKRICFISTVQWGCTESHLWAKFFLSQSWTDQNIILIKHIFSALTSLFWTSDCSQGDV